MLASRIARNSGVAVAMLVASCGNGAKEPAATAPVESGPVATAQAALPTGTAPVEGGTLTLNAQGKPVTVTLDFVGLTNTDAGYPDFVEIEGPGTFLAARIEPKMPSSPEVDDAYFAPVIGRDLPMDVPLDLLTTPRELTIPDQGTYPVTGGNITMEKFSLGKEGRAFWEGRITVTIQTSQGPVSLPGTFNVCIVPTW
ncbi:MAG: hypothetical protein SGI88_14840 [Candidatus Hydrogenedentes bacterium]|nr:hypothetical protein [Candidatus Hydrogenedentota bacterium]